ncbi:MAG: prefoldin subunit 4 [Amphiamblys sp. WSBS2006]|nr:MAG: prefoldin subunit 4 [Amphiamblys sp. WSBS2006]
MENDAVVLWEDQNRINSFSYLLSRKEELEEVFWGLEREEAAIKSLFEELDLVMEDRLYSSYGSGYIPKSVDKIREERGRQGVEIKERKDETRRKLEDISKEMAGIRTRLEERFGESINLGE